MSSSSKKSFSNTCSPSKVIESVKKRTLRIFQRRIAGRNSSHEATDSPIKPTAPLLASTPKPSPKKSSAVPLSDGQSQYSDPRLLQNAVVVLNKTVVDDYFAMKRATTKIATNQAKRNRTQTNGKDSGSSKKRTRRKQAALRVGNTRHKGSTRTPKSSRTVKRQYKPLAASPTLSTTPLAVTAAASATGAKELSDAEITTELGNYQQQEILVLDKATTKIPSDVLETFGIISHQQGVSSSSSCMTQPLSPERNESTPTPESLTENVPTPGSSNYYSTNETRETPSFHEVSDTSPTPALMREAGNSQAPLSNAKAKSPGGSEHNASVTSHLDLHFELTHRLYESPKTLQLDELDLGSKDVRRLAPYSMKVAPTENSFFQYVAALAEDAGIYCCVVFDIIDHYMVAYSGHFLIPKTRLYDPGLKIPVENVRLTKSAECRHHLCLLGVANEKLFNVDGYFLKTRGSSYDMLQSKFLDAFLRSLDQAAFKEIIRSESTREESNHKLANISSPSAKVFPVTSVLLEPRTTQLFYETCLPITQERMDRISKSVQAMTYISKHYAELASTQASCVFQRTFDTAYYAAHENAGCTSFYPNAYLLGCVMSHFVVGIVVDQTFFIMATKQLFSRFDGLAVGMRPMVPSNELFETITIPLSLPHEYSLIMLEVRQILKNPQKYPEFFKVLNKDLGISGFEPRLLPKLFYLSTAPEPQRQHNAWLGQMLDGYFNYTVRNTPCKFPVEPACLENPLMFCENMLKLWLQRLLREIHKISENKFSIFEDPTALSLQEFFTLSPVSYVEFFLQLFGLSDEHYFQCLTLDARGAPSGVCHEAICAPNIGRHIEDCHIRPLLWDDCDPMREVCFTPFVLVFRKRDNPPLSETCDFNLLSWARSMTEKWPVKLTRSYAQFVLNLPQNQKTLDSTAKEVAPATPFEKQGAGKMSSPHLPVAIKRKRSPGEVVEEELKRRCLESDLEEFDE